MLKQLFEKEFALGEKSIFVSPIGETNVVIIVVGFYPRIRWH